ncbi:hypothetical protein DFH09DRAFT_116748 [Mycena vulgaris]|nr:hypothetical protein DFH09DRAFT_258985 [Mycena vulgaris]KAJ6535237.1 hypothetical protein DFH09DRAFT_116748 [Mycena vulgaris]
MRGRLQRCRCRMSMWMKRQVYVQGRAYIGVRGAPICVCPEEVGRRTWRARRGCDGGMYGTCATLFPGSLLTLCTNLCWRLCASAALPHKHTPYSVRRISADAPLVHRRFFAEGREECAALCIALASRSVWRGMYAGYARAARLSYEWRLGAGMGGEGRGLCALVLTQPHLDSARCYSRARARARARSRGRRYRARISSCPVQTCDAALSQCAGQRHLPRRLHEL